MNVFRSIAIVLIAWTCVAFGAPAFAQSAYIASGTTFSDIQTTVIAFQAALGEPNNGNAVGSQGSGRRQITWDVGDNDAAPSHLPRDFFNAVAPRGAILSGPPGTTFMTSADATNDTMTPERFRNLNNFYLFDFGAFSIPRLFTPLGNNVMDVDIVIPGALEPAGASGFGAVFTDVDRPGTTKMELFDIGGALLYEDFVPAQPLGVISASLSFLGVIVPATGPMISKVRLTLGDAPVGPNDLTQGLVDIVVMDDFIYGEPLPLATLRIRDTTVTEGSSGQTQCVFSVVLSATSPLDVTAEYETHAAGATSPEDFESSTGFLTIPSGATETTVSVSVVADTIDEPEERFSLVLTGNSSHVYVPECRGFATILDDDAPSGNSLSGFVYEDIVFDGVKSATEPGVAGVLIEVTGIANLSAPLRRETRTDNDGYYSFPNLPPGVYHISKTPPAGYIDGSPVPGVPFGGNFDGLTRIEDIVIPVGVGSGVDYNFRQLTGIQSISEAAFQTPGDIQSFVGNFRAELGLGDNSSIVGSQGTGRREINWDDVPDSNSAPSRLPDDYFNTFRPRGAVFTSAGGRGQFRVSADEANFTGTLSDFGDINPTYPTAFQAFSAQRLFTSVSDNVFEIHFFVPGTRRPATVGGFGAVFTDVDTNGTTRIECFDAFGDLIFDRAILSSPGDASVSFLGLTIPRNAKQVARVRITLGEAPVGPNDITQGGADDIVVLDDILYAEPIPLEPIVRKTRHLLEDLDQDGEADPGDTLRYGIHVTNPLGFKVPDHNTVEFVDILPMGLSLTRVLATHGWNGFEAEGKAVVWNGVLPPLDRLTLDIDARADLSAGGRTLANQAVYFFDSDGDGINESSVFSDDPDTAAMKDPTIVSVQSTSAPNLGILKTVSSSSVVPPGGQVVYSVTVTNTGTAATSGAQVSDVLPAGLSGAIWTCASSGGASCSPTSGNGNVSAMVDLPLGGTVVFAVTATVSETALGTLSNTATISPPTGEIDPDPSDNSSTASVEIAPMADLEIEKVASQDSVMLGDTVVYSGTVRNNGPSRATGVKVADFGPPGASLVSSSLGCGPQGAGVVCDIGDLSSGQVTSVTLEVSLFQAGLVENIMQVEGNEPDPIPFNNVSEAAVFVTESAVATPSPTGTTADPTFHPADIDEDSAVGPKDVLELLAAWKIELSQP